MIAYFTVHAKEAALRSTCVNKRSVPYKIRHRLERFEKGPEGNSGPAEPLFMEM